MNEWLKLKMCAMLILAFFITWGCQKKEAVYVASINEEKITLDEYRERIFKQLNPPGTKAQITIPDAERFKDEILNIMIMERLMLQKARELSLGVSADELDKAVNDIKKDYSEDRFQQNFSMDKTSFDLWRSELKNRILMEKLVQAEVNSKISVSDTEAAAYYKAHMNTFKSMPRVHVAQIVVRDQAKAEAILKRLTAGKPFDTVAKEESIAPEAEKGGDLGFFPRGVLPEEIDSVVFVLPVGKTSRIVKSLYGYHIFKVLKKEPGGQKPFADVKGQIISDLQKKKEEEAYIQWLQALRSKATIRINSDVLKNLDIKSKSGEK
jgi:foldase protein PrsA